ncbi:MAG: accessory factor UbiK family protein [Rickettsiales bacterium]
MINNNKILNDLSNLANSAVGRAMDMKQEIDSIVAFQIEKLLKNMELVSKDEFDTMQAMLVKARNEQEELKKRVESLENQVYSLINTKKSSK